MAVSLLQKTLESITVPVNHWGNKAQLLLAGAFPYDEPGSLATLAARLCTIQERLDIQVSRRAVAIFASDHGVAEETVSVYPQEVTRQMVANFAAGGAGINAIAKVGRASLRVVDVGVKADFADLIQAGKIISRKIRWGSGNIAREPAMSRAQAVEALETGIAMAMELAWENDILIAGEKGIGNTTPSAAVVSVLLGCSALVATGRGTGLDEPGRVRKALLVEQAIACNKPDANDVLDVLSKVGGLDMAAMAGFYLGAAAVRRPIVLDGYIAGAAALVAWRLCPNVQEYMIAGHRSQEQGHKLVLDALGLKPLLDLGFRLGEATGAAMALPLLDCAEALLAQAILAQTQTPHTIFVEQEALLC